MTILFNRVVHWPQKIGEKYIKGYELALPTVKSTTVVAPPPPVAKQCTAAAANATTTQVPDTI